ncbi:MAG: DNA recombination/repair protein RecA, partial [Desulfovibrio sp.]|nr:DNA recombination/repair protein RecA [Desulfovibrio sp.]
RKIQSLKDKEEVYGNRTRVKVVKNKVAPPFRTAVFDILYGTGISRTGEILDLGVEAGIVEKSGSWLSYGKERLGQGKENARLLLEENDELRLEIERKLIEHLGMNPETLARVETELEDENADYASAAGVEA